MSGVVMRDGSDPPRCRILLIGPFPEPAGGVGIHLSRLAEALRDRSCEVTRIDESPLRKADIYNVRSLNPLGYFRRLLTADVAHIHSGITLFRCLHIIWCRLLGVRTVVTVHSMRASSVGARVNSLILRLAHEVIVVNRSTNEPLRLPRCHVLPAFLPPDSNDERPLPSEVQGFIDEARGAGRRLLCANAYKLVLHDRQDLYGLDLCVELMCALVREHRLPVACVYVVASDARDNPLYQRAVERIKDAGLREFFCLYNGSVPFTRVIQQCDLVVRPTTTDADALTVREALWFGKPVIASDVVERPPGTYIFGSRNRAALVAATLDVLQNHRTVACSDANADYLRSYLELYAGAANEESCSE